MSADSTTIYQFTDTHIYHDTQKHFDRMDTKRSFERVLDGAMPQITSRDYVLLSGDLAADAEAGAYEWLTESLSNLDVPIACIPGNHDVNETMVPILQAAGWNCRGLITTASWQIILLDSVIPHKAHGELSHSELERLDELLGNDRDKHVLVALHHHPVPIRSAWMDAMQLVNAKAFWQIIDRHPHVRCVLWGHVHQNYDAYRNAVRLLATPSTCVQFTPRSQGFAIDTLAPGYRRLTLRDDGRIQTTVHRLPRAQCAGLRRF